MEYCSRQAAFFQRVNSYLLENQTKIEEYNSLTNSYNDKVMDASTYIEFLHKLFNKNPETVGKVISGFADLLDNEIKKIDLLRALHDFKATVSIFISCNINFASNFTSVFQT